MKERDEELARSIDPDAWRKIHKDDADWCQQFADLVRADEREACAKVCDDYDVKYDVCGSDTAEGIALQIRARGNI
jgi:hypothetical protein